MIEEVKEILEEYVGFPPSQVPDWVDWDIATQQICQLIEPIAKQAGRRGGG